MNRLLASLVFSVMISTHAMAWDLGKIGKFSFKELTSNVFVMHGPTGLPSPANEGFMNNPGLIVLEKGLVVVDPGSSYHVGKKILAEIQKVSNKPILAVFNSHIHGDHWLGNQAIKEAFPDVKIYGNTIMIERAKGGEAENWVGIMKRLIGKWIDGSNPVLPDMGVKDGDIIKVAGANFKIHAPEKSHTNTDIMVEHIESKTIFLGDNGFVRRLGNFDSSGEIHGNIDALEKVENLKLSFFVPGHGPSGNAEKTLAPFLVYMRKLRDGVTEGYREEKQDFEIRKRIAPSFTAYQAWKGFNENFGKHVSKMYTEVEEREF